MAGASQRRAVANDRRRLREQGMSRYEVRGLAADKDLVRSVARRLAENDRAAAELRADLGRKLDGQPTLRGGIVRALLDSPFAGADLDIVRDRGSGRDIDL